MTDIKVTGPLWAVNPVLKFKESLSDSYPITMTVQPNFKGLCLGDT